METSLTTCPRCQGAMHEGFVFDSGLASIGVASWFAGPPKMRYWGGGVDLVGSRLKRVKAYRCEQCSYLELYAP